MAFEIQAVDENNFLLNGSIKSRSYRSFAEGDNVSVVSDGSSNRSITIGSNVSNFTIKDASGSIILDGSTGSTANEIAKSLNSIVNYII